MRLTSECSAARRDMLIRDDLPATARGRLDLHLRRCEACRAVYEDLCFIEDFSFPVDELDDTRRRVIYNGLIPVVNEITNDSTLMDSRARGERWWSFVLNPPWVFAGAAAVAIVVAFVIVLAGPAENSSESGADRAAMTQLREEIQIRSIVDRHEGSIRIDGLEVPRRESFGAKRGTYVETASGSRFNFQIGDLARVAMFGDTKWELLSVSDAHIAINLDQGSMAVEFDGSLKKTMEITTPDSIVRVTGTIFTVEVFGNGSTEVGVIEGRVEVLSKHDKGTMKVGAGELGTFPGDGVPTSLTDRHRTLAAEMSIARYPVELTKLVSFDGSPERVKVEVDGRVLGTTPLAVRLPDAPFAYRLTSPGMEPVSGSVVDHRHSGNIEFSLVPSEEFEPIPDMVFEPETKGERRARSGMAKKRRKKQDWNLFKRARSAMRAGDLPYAIGLLERAIVDVESEKRSGALSLLAESYAASGMYHKAASVYDRLADVADDAAMVQNARYEVGRLSMDQLGDLSRARAAFTAYVASPIGGGLREDAYYSLCELDGREGSHRDSLHCFNQFLRSFAGGVHEPLARAWRGALLQDVEKNWKLAEEDLMYFVRSKPHHPRSDEARYRVVIGRYQMGERAGTIQMISEYVENHPNGQYRVRVERIESAVRDPNFLLKHRVKK